MGILISIGAGGAPPSLFVQTQPCRGPQAVPFQAWLEPLSPFMAGQALLQLSERTGRAGVVLGDLLHGDQSWDGQWPSCARHLLGADTALEGPQDWQEGTGGSWVGRGLWVEGAGRRWVVGAGTDTGCACSTGGAPAACPHHCPEAPAN